VLMVTSRASTRVRADTLSRRVETSGNYPPFVRQLCSSIDRISEVIRHVLKLVAYIDLYTYY
jgi:hypothetical protein